MRLWLLVGAAMLLVLAWHPGHAHGASDRGLAGQFMCQCGCGLTLASCTHAACGPRDQALAEIARLEQAGRTPQQIQAAMVAQYGEAVLSAPTRRGFNLVAWWGPYAALGTGAVIILALGTAWVRRPRREATIPLPPLTAEQRELLQRELEQFED